MQEDNIAPLALKRWSQLRLLYVCTNFYGQHGLHGRMSVLVLLSGSKMGFRPVTPIID